MISDAEQIGAPHVLVRSATVDDFWDIMRIEKLCFPTPWPEQAMWEDLSQLGEQKVYLVVELDERLVGYVGAHCVAGEVHVVTVAIAPECRRTGLGELLLLVLIDLVALQGAHYVTLEYRTSNQSAGRLYHKLGFVRAGLRKRYYPDTGEDAIISNLADLQEPHRQQALADLTEDWRRRHRYDLHICI